MFQDDFTYMRRAIKLAEEAAKAGEIPVGAVIADRETGEILGEGRNRREETRSPLAHAEIIAIDAAARAKGTWRLGNCVLYVTLEPCPMCAGAILAARIARVCYGAADKTMGALESADRMFCEDKYPNTPRITAGLLEEPCGELMRTFFQNLRGQNL